MSSTSEVADSLVHAFISCHLDYCNALLYGIADGQLQRLQSVLFELFEFSHILQCSLTLGEL